MNTPVRGTTTRDEYVAWVRWIDEGPRDAERYAALVQHSAWLTEDGAAVGINGNFAGAVYGSRDPGWEWELMLRWCDDLIYFSWRELVPPWW